MTNTTRLIASTTNTTTVVTVPMCSAPFLIDKCSFLVYDWVSKGAACSPHLLLLRTDQSSFPAFHRCRPLPRSASFIFLSVRVVLLFRYTVVRLMKAAGRGVSECLYSRSHQQNPATRAKEKYNAAHYDQVKFTVYKGGRDVIDDAASKAGMSRNAYILEAIKERMERDGISYDLNNGARSPGE